MACPSGFCISAEKRKPYAETPVSSREADSTLPVGRLALHCAQVNKFRRKVSCGGMADAVPWVFAEAFSFCCRSSLLSLRVFIGRKKVVERTGKNHAERLRFGSSEFTTLLFALIRHSGDPQFFGYLCVVKICSCLFSIQISEHG